MAIYDNDHITGQLTFAEIGEAIRHKKYGSDMREAIAQGFEYFNGLQEKVANLQETVGLLQNGVGRLQGDVLTLQSEVHNLEIDNANLQKRITNLENAVFGDAVLVTDTDDKPDITTS